MKSISEVMELHKLLLRKVYVENKSKNKALVELRKDLNSYRRVENIILLNVTRADKFQRLSSKVCPVGSYHKSQELM